MEEKLLPVGTKVFIKDGSKYYNQGVDDKRNKMQGEITCIDTSEVGLNGECYPYKVTWYNRGTNIYRMIDIEPIDGEIREEQELNEELNKLFNQILNN